jgi:hypothetical protein
MPTSSSTRGTKPVRKQKSMYRRTILIHSSASRFAGCRVMWWPMAHGVLFLGR